MKQQKRSFSQHNQALAPFVSKMRNASLPQVLIDTFTRYYNFLSSGQQGFIPEHSIEPLLPSSIQHLDDIHHFTSSGLSVLPRTAILKLNGGLGTTMGCSGPKSIISIKNDLTFLDIIIEHLACFNNDHTTNIPLLLMNSFSTDEQTRTYLDQYYSNTSFSRPGTFSQHKFPKVLKSTLSPATFPENPVLEWNPPGHGDIYLSLVTSGFLDKLLSEHYKYLFISNSDNLGAHIDPSIPGFMEAYKCDFLMEVAERVESDQKGGHVARLSDGNLVLREIRQCPDDDLPSFQNITKHRYFNTNNIWINLEALHVLIGNNGGQIDLPLICNKKNLDPRQPSSPEVFQLESAMGSAICLFKNAAVLHVPRNRFFPVKNCEDLLLLQSDFFDLTSKYTFEPKCTRTTLPIIQLSPEYYFTTDQLLRHTPLGPPSLRLCSRLRIIGEVYFGKNNIITGDVTITNTSQKPYYLPDHLQIDTNLTV